MMMCTSTFYTCLYTSLNVIPKLHNTPKRRAYIGFHIYSLGTVKELVSIIITQKKTLSRFPFFFFFLVEEKKVSP